MTEYKGYKRTKEYKQWKKNHEAGISGLGDVVEKITTATGIKAAVEFFAGSGSGVSQSSPASIDIFKILLNSTP